MSFELSEFKRHSESLEIFFLKKFISSFLKYYDLSVMTTQ